MAYIWSKMLSSLFILRAMPSCIFRSSFISSLINSNWIAMSSLIVASSNALICLITNKIQPSVYIKTTYLSIPFNSFDRITKFFITSFTSSLLAGLLKSFLRWIFLIRTTSVSTNLACFFSSSLKSSLCRIVNAYAKKSLSVTTTNSITLVSLSVKFVMFVITTTIQESTNTPHMHPRTEIVLPAIDRG